VLASLIARWEFPSYNVISMEIPIGKSVTRWIEGRKKQSKIQN
jgi:hypothetical protein